MDVRPASREVLSGGQREVLEPLVMQVLVLLASARAEILSRDDLIEACWGRRAVTDDAINRVISRLRALARSFGGFEVETVTKVGYRLVETGGDAGPTQTGISRRPLLIGGAALAAVAAGGWFAWTRFAADPREASVAVIPFANLSGDPSRQYFADGLAEELRNALARIDRLKVIGRTSSESVRALDARAAAQKLGVGHILLGSVRQSPSTIRVSAQLIDGSTGVELWSETYDRPPGDILVIQSGIAQNVAQAMIVRLAADERAALNAGGTTSAAAYDLMLQGLALDASFDSEEAQRKVLGYMDAAIALDPRYADAHATRGLRLCQIATYFVPSIATGRAMNGGAIQSARRAVELAPGLASGHSALGWTLQYDLQFQAAKLALERAYRLGRGDARTLRIYGTFLWKIGKIREALKIVGESAALDPLHPRHQVMLGQTLLAAGRYDEAASAAGRALTLAPTRVNARVILAHSLILQDRIRQAQAEADLLPPKSIRRLTAEAILLDRSGDRLSSDLALSEMKLRFGDLVNYEMAVVHAQRGEKDQALTLLEAAWRQQDPDLSGLAGDRMLDPLRGEPRFQNIVRRLNIPA